MVIIPRRKKREKKAFEYRFEAPPISKEVEHVHSAGFTEEEDVEDDPKALRKLRKTHPFMRDERMEWKPPEVIRWMWNPQTGEMISKAGRTTEHALILKGFEDALKRRGKKRNFNAPPHNYGFWIRGFYFPRTNELAMRPYDISVLEPSALLMRDPDNEEKFLREAGLYSTEVQRRLKELLEKQMRRKFKKVYYDVGTEDLRQHFGYIRDRW